MQNILSFSFSSENILAESDANFAQKEWTDSFKLLISNTRIPSEQLLKVICEKVPESNESESLLEGESFVRKYSKAKNKCSCRARSSSFRFVFLP